MPKATANPYAGREQAKLGNRTSPQSWARSVLHDNGLTIALLLLFSFAIAAMALTGWRAHNTFLAEHGSPPLGLAQYLGSGDFASAVFENWESEFLQMATYVILTAMLFQRGSAESRDPDGENEELADGASQAQARGLARVLYEYSLGIALGLLFVGSFALHLWGSYRAAVAEALVHGEAPPALSAYLGDAGFWFESFQNWQSEFLATAALVVLSIVLRFGGSPESKHVDAGNAETGR
jgi:hypothetical protein